MQRVDDLLRPNSPPNALSSQLYSSYKYLVTHVWWLFSSIIFGTMTTIVWFGVGIWTLMTDRDYGHAIMGEQETENEELDWGFGQLVPLIFCILPSIAAGEAWWGKPTHLTPQCSLNYSLTTCR